MTLGHSPLYVEEKSSLQIGAAPNEFVSGRDGTLDFVKPNALRVGPAAVALYLQRPRLWDGQGNAFGFRVFLLFLFYRR